MGLTISGFDCWRGVFLVVWSFLASWFGGSPWRRVCGTWWLSDFSGVLSWCGCDVLYCVPRVCVLWGVFGFGFAVGFGFVWG